MESKRIPKEEKPTDDQLKYFKAKATLPHRAPGDACVEGLYTGAFCASFNLFLQNPPDGVKVFEYECTPDSVRIPFAASVAWEQAKNMKLSCFVMDFTFKTNKDGLLLGAAGPVGLRVGRDGLPHMRFFPCLFMLADREDHDAHGRMLKLLLESRGDKSVPYTDGFLDHTCLKGAEACCGDRVFLHRCLQHTKADLKKAAHTYVPGGFTRLRRLELLPVLVDRVDFSAWLDNDDEFHVLWVSTLERMRGDWKETEMAEYLETHLLTQVDGQWRAKWSSGLGSVPLGFTTYADNTIEVSHRVLKGILGSKCRWLDVVDLMTRACNAVQSRISKGVYENLFESHEKPWPCLLEWRNPKWQSRKAIEKGPDGNALHSQVKRLDVKTMNEWYHEHLAENTFLRSRCDKRLSSGEQARLVYVMPTYTLKKAMSERSNMMCRLRLALTTSHTGVRDACQHMEIGTYDPDRHMTLRHAFTAVFLTTCGKLVDTHKHYVESLGQSEHSWFFTGLEKPSAFPLAPFAQGPRNSLPTCKRPKPKAKRSSVLSAMLKPLPVSIGTAKPIEHGTEPEDVSELDLDMADIPHEMANAMRTSGTKAVKEKKLSRKLSLSAPVEVIPGRCMGRIWDGGRLSQCTRHPQADSDFCAGHKKNLAHGRIDEQTGDPKAVRTAAVTGAPNNGQGTAAAPVACRSSSLLKGRKDRLSSKKDAAAGAADMQVSLSETLRKVMASSLTSWLGFLILVLTGHIAVPMK